MKNTGSPLALVLLATTVACTGQMPPPPVLSVTSPERGLMQDAGKVTVTGIALPNEEGDPVSGVSVNGVAAKLAADGSFTVAVDVPDGATILKTVATTDYGGMAVDARSVQSGMRREVDTTIERAVIASLSTDAFAKISAAAGPQIMKMDLPARLAPLQPMANLGDSIANVKLSINKLVFTDVKVALQPIDGGLKFSAEIDGIEVGAVAAYAGTLVPDGSTTIGVTADRITIAGTLVVTPTNANGFSMSIASPDVQVAALHLRGNGLVGTVLDLVQNNLGSTMRGIMTKAAEKGLEPIMNQALGALGGPQEIDVMGKHLSILASPAGVLFSAAGAVVSMNVSATISNGRSSLGYIYTPNGTPVIDASTSITLGIADDMVNSMLAQIHASGALDVHVDKDIGFFDSIDLKLAAPPMISADNDDGSMRLVLGDMIATIKDDGKEIVSAAVNALVDLTIVRGESANQIALSFGHAEVYVNLLNNPTEGAQYDVSDATSAGIALQLDKLDKFFVNVPIPAVAGLQLDSLEMHADSGYLIASGDIH